MNGYGFDVGTSGYDDEDRLVSWNRDDNNLDQAWNLSLVGDWNSVTENASTQSRTHGPTHELLTAAGQTITHDAKGNQTSIPAVLRVSPSPNLPLSLQWDFENKLISADTDNDAVADVTYQWDALGRRVGRDDGTTNTVFVQSGHQTIADYTSGTAAASPTYNYAYASYIDEPVMRAGTGGNRYYHRGQQYSVVGLTNGSGSVVERYAYSAYGGVDTFDGAGVATSSSDNRYTYTGREWDNDLDLYHYRARMYCSLSGRFVSRDPIGYVDGYSQYGSYFAISDLDPSGLSKHHWFPQALLPQLNGKCSEVFTRLGVSGKQFIDLFTSELGPWGGGHLHTEVQTRDPRGKWNDHVKDIIENSSDCCDAIKKIRESIPDWLQAAQDRLRLVSTGGMPNMTKHRGNGAGGKQILLDHLIDTICGWPPENPCERPQPVRWWVPITVPRWIAVPEWLEAIPPRIQGGFPTIFVMPVLTNPTPGAA